MSITYRLQGNAINKNLRIVLKRAQDDTVKDARNLAHAIANEAERSMVWARGAPNGKPSPPGLPPHKQTGKGSKSFVVKQKTNSKTSRVGFEISISEKGWYMRLHEKGGTFSGAKRKVYFPKRPFLAPAARRVLAKWRAKHNAKRR